MTLARLGASALALAMFVTATPGIAAAQQHSSGLLAHENPWHPDLAQVEPLRVLDPKAEAMVSVAEGREAVFEITLEDVGLYFGYLIPAHVAGFETARVALAELYPEGLPERGQIRVAAPRQNDIVLVASYLTGAREFYLVGGVAESDLVIDPTLGADRPGKYVMIFQRKDTGRTVEAVFDRQALVPDNTGEDYGRTAPIYIDLLNNRRPDGDPARHRQIMTDLMQRTLSFDKDRLYFARTIPGYDFPSVTDVEIGALELSGPAGAWFAAGEAMDSGAYAELFAPEGRLVIANAPPATGRDAIASAAQSFFDTIDGLDHRITSVWQTDGETLVEGVAVYEVSGQTVTLPMTAIIRTTSSGELIREARIYIDPTPLAQASSLSQ